MPYISALYRYPIKSCAGHALTRAELTPRGIRHDREWMVVDTDGVFLSQRTHPALALVRPAIGEGVLTVSAPGMEDLTVETPDEGDARPVVVWRDRCAGVDQGHAAARWFGDYLGTPCRLVRMQRSFVRPVDRTYARRPTDQVGFADGYPLLLISEASLADLNARLPDPVPMNRFRPNLVAADTVPYAEDAWRRIRAGNMVFDVVKPCGRCVTTTVDQQSGVKDAHQEPLRTLAEYRRAGSKAPAFGQNLIHETPGAVAVGEDIEVLVKKDKG
jgi:uncharacterized protein YcbX